MGFDMIHPANSLSNDSVMFLLLYILKVQSLRFTEYDRNRIGYNMHNYILISV